MTGREQRLAANEALFREVNEQIRAAAAAHGDDAHVYEFLCECSDRACAARLRLALGPYRRVRDDPRRFLVVPGHEVPAIEHVVGQGDGYAVVEKDGEAAELVERLAGNEDDADSEPPVR